MKRCALLLALLSPVVALAAPAPDVQRRVQTIFAEVRKGRLDHVEELAKLGAQAVPYLTPLVQDKSEEARREAVVLLGLSRSKDAIPALGKAAADPVWDIARRAAPALLFQFDAADVAARPAIVPDLMRGVTAHDSGAAVLLLGYFDDAPSLALLSSLATAPDGGKRKAKLHDGSLPVSFSRVAAVALARRGDARAIQSLLDVIAAKQQDDVRFFLEILELPLVRDAKVLDALRRATLADERPWPGQGRPFHTTEPRRLCDAAVDAFAHRFKLDVVKLAPSKRYSPVEIAQLQQALDASLPR